MDNDDDEEEFERQPSAIILIFERLVFERGQDVHDFVSSMTHFFSSIEVKKEKSFQCSFFILLFL